MELVQLILELENEMIDKRGYYRKKIDIEKCVSIIDEIKTTVPQQSREMDHVLGNKQKVLENADIVAKNIIREAEERVDHLVDNSEIVRRAEIEAKAVMETAYVQSDKLILRTKEHLDKMFKESEDFLMSNISMIRNNREELRLAMIPLDRRKI